MDGKTPWTKGPWSSEQEMSADGWSLPEWTVTSDTETYPDGMPVVVASVYRKTDAPIVAAAPALAEALEALINDPHSASAWSKADAALKSAKGET